MKFNEVVANVASGVRENNGLPLHYREALKYHGVGPVNIHQLIDMGLVEPKPRPLPSKKRIKS